MPIYVSVSILQISSPSAVLWDPSRWSRQACIRSRWSMSGKSLCVSYLYFLVMYFFSLSFFIASFLSHFFVFHRVRLSFFVHSIWFTPVAPWMWNEIVIIFLFPPENSPFLYLGRNYLQFFISSTFDFRDGIFCLLVFVFPVHLVHRWLKIQDSYDLWALNVFRFLAIVLLLRILHYDGW